MCLANGTCFKMRAAAQIDLECELLASADLPVTAQFTPP
jgi:hypothetical protein